MFQLILHIAITDPEEAAWMLGHYHFDMTKTIMNQIRRRMWPKVKKKELFRAYRQGARTR